MTGKNLGRLERVEVREQWADEARHFTPWLASAEGLALMGDTIGMDLELVGQEQCVGPFRADILARDASSDEDHLIIIENQFEKTNHDHLGKIITYAAGQDARTIVWVAETFTDEHRQALDWLNENTGENLAFFGLQIELWRIGDSVSAPQFKIVSSPNEWTRAVQGGQPREVTDTKMDQLRFWEEVREYGRTHGTALQFRKPRPQHWYDIAVGRSGFWIALSLNSFQQRIRCALIMRGPQVQAGFGALESHKDAIEAEIGQKLEWRRERGRSGSMISIARTGLLIEDSRQREEAKAWLVDMAERFHKAFASRIQTLRLNVTTIDDEEENHA
jgi:hypothetical protein